MEQLTVERCIDIHDTSTATHVFIHRGLNATYLLRNVEVRNSGLIYADYGVIGSSGAFMGWVSQDPDASGYGDPQPGLFVPASGRLLPYKPWEREHEAETVRAL